MLGGYPCHTTTSRSGCANGSGANSTLRTTEKMAVLAPIPSASVRTATAVNPGARISSRRAYRASFSMSRLDDGGGGTVVVGGPSPRQRGNGHGRDAKRHRLWNPRRRGRWRYEFPLQDGSAHIVAKDPQG